MGEALTTIWNTIIYYPILNILVALYHLLGNNLILAISVIAIVVRLILIPTTRQQTEMSKKMKILKPKLAELQKKYGNNQEKLAKEQMRLYKEVGYNPLGCITSFLPLFVILLVVMQVIRVVTANEMTGIYPFVQNWVAGEGQTVVIQTSIWGLDLARSFKSFIVDCNCIPEVPVIKSILVYIMGPFKVTASIPYFVLAIAVGVVQYISSSLISYIQQGDDAAKLAKKKLSEMTQEEAQVGFMKYMNVVLSFMTAFIALDYAAVLTIYWLVQSIMLLVQYFIIDRKKTADFFLNAFNFSKFFKNERERNTDESRRDSK